MKIFSAAKSKELDNFTIKNEPITSIDLMERASKAFCREFISRYDNGNKISVYVGPGNNGGDGLAVARILSEFGYDIKVYLPYSVEEISIDSKINFDRLPAYITKHKLSRETLATDESDIIIDSLFGSGLTRPLSGELAELVTEINSKEAEVVSIDIPSGWPSEGSTQDYIAISADLCICLDSPKVTLLYPESANTCKEWVCVDIGLSLSKKKEVTTKYQLFIPNPEAPSLSKFAHKGDRGKCLIIGGSAGMEGAAFLSAAACLKSGAGLVSIYSIDGNTSNRPVEIMSLSSLPDLQKFDSIAIGPGLGQTSEAKDVVYKVLLSKKPAVIDADAINIISQDEHLKSLLKPHHVLTPHLVEFQRLAGKQKDTASTLSALRHFVDSHNCTIVLKGHFSAVTSKNQSIFFNTSGNSGMATAGSGDVLSGMLCCSLSQQNNHLTAVSQTVCSHGCAGDLARFTKGKYTAADIIESIT